MKIVFINQYYWPDVAATAQMLTDLCEFLAERGNEVHVLCSRAAYENFGRDDLRPFEQHGGVNIHRLRAWGSRGKGTFSRLLAYAGFHLLSGGWLLTKGRRFDIVVALTEPPLIGVWPALLRQVSRFKFVCWTMDLYTDCLFALGSVNPKRPLGVLLEALNRFELKRADCVVTLGPCARRRVLAKGVKPEQVRTIGAWSRADLLTPIPPAQSVARRVHGLQDKFVVMYSGNAGRSHTFDEICGAMLALRADPQVVFLFVGGGKRANDVEAFAQSHELANFKRLPYFPLEELNDSLAIGDVHLVSLHPNMSGVVVPSKIYGILAAGRPAVYVGPTDSSVAQAILDADAGIIVPPGGTEVLVAGLRRLAADSPERQRLGGNGRRYFLEHHEHRVCCGKWARLLEELCAGQGESSEMPHQDSRPFLTRRSSDKVTMEQRSKPASASAGRFSTFSVSAFSLSEFLISGLCPPSSAFSLSAFQRFSF
jgi:colanic acid biosynthesis glycosyl transferase WcaI